MKAMKFTMVVSALGAAAMVLANPATASSCDGSRTRAEVVAETLAARAAGELGVMNGEDSGSFHLSRQTTASPLERAEVVAGMLSDRARGEGAGPLGEDSGSFKLSREAWRSARTRDEVVAEAIAAAREAQQAHVTGEDGGAVGTAVVQVRSDLPRAVAHAMLQACPLPLAAVHRLAAAR